jgi:hypothetical protein
MNACLIVHLRRWITLRAQCNPYALPFTLLLALIPAALLSSLPLLDWLLSHSPMFFSFFDDRWRGQLFLRSLFLLPPAITTSLALGYSLRYKRPRRYKAV